jgi:hypothetical protein
LSAALGLVAELLRDAARDRRCGACGRGLGEAQVEPDVVDPEQIVARFRCACGAVEIVEVRPAGDGGVARIG